MSYVAVRAWYRQDVDGLGHVMIDEFSLRRTLCRRVYAIDPTWENMDNCAPRPTCLFCISATTKMGLFTQ